MTNALTGATLPHASCIVIATDGSCQPNPGPGGYGAILHLCVDGRLKRKFTLTGGDTRTTNIRMEMSAVIAALGKISRDQTLPIIVRTDNEMIVKGMKEWLPGWVEKGWRKGNGKPVENADLWQEIARLCDGLDVTFQWVRGHAGDPMNEEADRLAAKACAVWMKKAAKELLGEAA